MWSSHAGNLGDVIDAKLGPDVAKYFRRYLERMAGKDELNEALGMKAVSQWLSMLQASYIGLSPLTLVRQYVSLINTGSRGEVSKGQILSTLYRYATDPLYRQETEERIKSLAPEIAGTDLSVEIAWQRRMEHMQFQSDSTKARARDFFTSWVRYHDKVTKEVAWMAVFENARVKNGMSEADAAFQASEAVQETMSVTDPGSRSELQNKQSAFVRFIFMFSTDIFNNWNILFGDVPTDIREGLTLRKEGLDEAHPDPVKVKEGNRLIFKGMKRLGGFVASAAALALIQGGWLPDGDDDDDDGFNIFDLNGFMADVIPELVSGIPVIGLPFNDLARGFVQQEIPVVTDALRNVKKVFSSDTDIPQKLDAVIDTALTGLSLAGFPTNSAQRAVNTIYTPEGGFFFNPLAFLNADYGNYWKWLFD